MSTAVHSNQSNSLSQPGDHDVTTQTAEQTATATPAPGNPAFTLPAHAERGLRGLLNHLNQWDHPREWRADARRLFDDAPKSWQHGVAYDGYSARGREHGFSVASERHTQVRYRVSLNTARLHAWRCECPAGAMHRPCKHVGACLALGASLILTYEPCALDVRFGVGTAHGYEWLRVSESTQRLWRVVNVLYDQSRGAVLGCAHCERSDCEHAHAALLWAHRRERIQLASRSEVWA